MSHIKKITLKGLVLIVLMAFQIQVRAGHDGNGGFVFTESKCFNALKNKVKHFQTVIKYSGEHAINKVVGKKVDYNKILNASKNIKISPTTVRTRVNESGYEDYLMLDYITDEKGPGIEILSHWFLACSNNIEFSNNLHILLFHEVLHHVGFTDSQARKLRSKFSTLERLARVMQNDNIPTQYKNIESLYNEEDSGDLREIVNNWLDGDTYPMSVMLVPTAFKKITPIEFDLSKPYITGSYIRKLRNQTGNQGNLDVLLQKCMEMGVSSKEVGNIFVNQRPHRNGWKSCKFDASLNNFGGFSFTIDASYSHFEDHWLNDVNYEVDVSRIMSIGEILISNH